MKMRRIPSTRRNFLGQSIASLATISIVPSYVLGLRGQTPPSEKLNIAGIGVGGQGEHDINQVGNQNIVALCDVDSKRSANSSKKFPKAKQFQDYRKMLDELDKEIDAVLVATPDHSHAVPVVRAAKMKKHVFCEKPLAHSIFEVRAMMKAVRENNVVSQLGNQGHSFDSMRVFREWVEDGMIGQVREVHAMCRSVYSGIDRIEDVRKGQPVPENLNWDLWLGPAQHRNYHPAYVPGGWRSWSAFGTGVIGDWTCHVLDPVYWTLDLGAPETIEAEVGDYDPRLHGDTFPRSSVVRFQFPARGNRPPVKVTWYDGPQKPPKPQEMADDKDDKLPDIGALVIGDSGKIVYGSHGAGGVRLLSEEKMDAAHKQPRRHPKSIGHYKEWVECCKSGKPAGSHFDYGGPLTEVALLGVIAIMLKGQKLTWDGANGTFKNNDAANRLLKPLFRDGWTL